MGNLGWSYPPGCSGTPFDQDDGISGLQEKVLELLEAAGIPTEVNDKIIKLISEAEIIVTSAEQVALTDSPALADAEFEELKKRFPSYVTDDDRALGFSTLMRIIEDRITEDETAKPRSVP